MGGTRISLTGPRAARLFFAVVAGLGLALGVAAASCGGGSRTLLLVDVFGDQDYQDTNMTVTITGGTSKTFHHATFTPLTSFQAGVYVADGVTGVVQVDVQVDDGHCVIATAATLATIARAGDTVPAPTLTVTHVGSGGPCIPIATGTGGSMTTGTGGSGAGGGGGGIVGAGTGGGIIIGAGTGGGIIISAGTGGGIIVGAGTGGGIVTSGTGGHIGTGGIIVTPGTGGGIVTTGPGCPIVQCPTGGTSCCLGWFSFAIDYYGLSLASVVTGFNATSSSVSATYSFTAGSTGVRQIAAVGVDLTSQINISQVKIKASSAGPMPIYASFENPSGSAHCLYAFTTDGDYLVTAASPVTGTCDNYPAGVASKINIKMDSETSAAGQISVTQLIIVP